MWHTTMTCYKYRFLAEQHGTCLEASILPQIKDIVKKCFHIVKEVTTVLKHLYIFIFNLHLKQGCINLPILYQFLVVNLVLCTY